MSSGEMGWRGSQLLVFAGTQRPLAAHTQQPCEYMAVTPEGRCRVSGCSAASQGRHLPWQQLLNPGWMAGPVLWCDRTHQRGHPCGPNACLL